MKGSSALARQMLKRCGSLRALLAVDQKELREQKGLGPAKHAQLQAALEMARWHFAAALNFTTTPPAWPSPPTRTGASRASSRTRSRWWTSGCWIISWWGTAKWPRSPKKLDLSPCPPWGYPI